MVEKGKGSLRLPLGFPLQVDDLPAGYQQILDINLRLIDETLLHDHAHFVADLFSLDCLFDQLNCLLLSFID